MVQVVLDTESDLGGEGVGIRYGVNPFLNVLDKENCHHFKNSPCTYKEDVRIQSNQINAMSVIRCTSSAYKCFLLTHSHPLSSN